MQNKIKLITGASGEIGKALIEQFKYDNVITLDIDSLDSTYKTHKHFVGSILDTELLNKINNEYQIVEVYHLAAILSTKAEKNPKLATEVNIDGTNNLYDLCLSQIKKYNQSILFFFPSSIAIYNMPNKNIIEEISEMQYCNNPYTVYGKSKLFCEKKGYQYTQLYKRFDYRCIRFPGIISSETIPSGGTSDYASEMLHSAVAGNSYSCFVDSRTILPFIVMPDAISAIIKLMNAPPHKLTLNSYNITSFSPNVVDIENKIKEFIPNFHMVYNSDIVRQNIVDSWPSLINDSLAKQDWGWHPAYNFNRAFKNYIIPNLYNKYHTKEAL